jgi:hypothetical protein
MVRPACIIALCLAAGSAQAGRERDEDPAVTAERDALIDKIARGVDYEASVKRFGELVKARDQVIATSAAARQKEQEARDAERKVREERRKVQDDYKKTLDHEVSWRCTLSPDPANPIPSKEGRFKGDWGKVIRKQQFRLPPKNDLDDGEPATVIEVKGVARNYVIHTDKFAPDHKNLDANVGDLMMVCFSGEDLMKGLPPGWGERVLRGGFAGRIAQPPLIVKKAKWQPIHVTGTVFYWAIADVKWRFQPTDYLLSHIEIGKEFAPNQFEIETNNNKSWILEVPTGLKNREWVKPGALLWVILGQQRFDKGIKKLVLVAQDLETRYVLER